MIVFAHAVWPTSQLPAIIAAFASIVPTLVSYRWVEEPIRHDQRIVGRSLVGLSIVCVVCSVTACMGLRLARRFWIHRGGAPAIVTAHAQHADSIPSCGTGKRVDAGRSCMWPASGSKRGTIYLAGDSNAGQLTEAVVAAGNSLGYDVITRTHHGCPFVDLEGKRLRTADDVADSPAVCRAFVLDSIPAIIKATPALVIVADQLK